MENSYLYALLSVGLVSLVSFIGVFTLSLSDKKLGKILIYMISFAAGGLLGDAFLHLLPEMAAESGFGVEAALFVLSGIAISFVMEKVIRWRHCHHVTCADHPHPVAFMNLFGDGVHNFIDGLIIGASYLVSIPVGVATTVAVVLHEIPQEIGDFGILLHGGFSRRKALLLNFAIALTSVLGVGVAILLSAYMENVLGFLIPFAAGSFIYIAVADLIPEMHKEVSLGRSVLQFVFFMLGIGLMWGMLFLEL
jgi:zinc and cadmium transporter